VPTFPLSALQRETVDEAAKLLIEVAALNKSLTPKTDRLALLKLEIGGWYPKLGQAETQLVEGHHYQIRIGARTWQYPWISMDAIQKAVGGWKQFKRICQVTYAALSELPVGEDNAVFGTIAAKALQTKEQTGWRKFEAEPIVVVPCQQLPRAA
jgi:hypothetical protein